MSYFICGFKTNAVACDRLTRILGEMVPKHLRTDHLQMSSSPYLAVYGHKKVIQHLVIHDRRSWLVIIGTPLVRLNSEHQKPTFLADFLTNPMASLRDTIDGNFAVFAYDAPRDRLIAATDLNNTTPIFYTATAHGLFFSSHELALARLLTPEIDPFGFAQTIHLGVPWGSYTRFRNISKLLPCQVLAVDGDKELHLERYWRPQDETVWSGTLDEHIEKWGSLLRESVQKFYECSERKPVISDFTAGEDARVILAQCHALGIPFKAHVKGSVDDVDVIVATRAANKAGFDLIKRDRHHISQEQLLANAASMCLESDAYLEYFNACADYATDLAEPLDDYSVVKFCGLPGGEAFRGSYYLRGKAIFPTRRTPLDFKFFTRMKYLLDHRSGLTRYGDAEFVDRIHQIVRENLRDVADFPIGTQIDHMLRVFQTCFTGLMYKSPLYMPLATNPMTRSIYCLSPRFKQGGRLTKACTERLFPELAFVNTQNGVPTIRRTLWRQPLFVPEYIALLRTVSKGTVSRLFKWTRASAWQYGADFTTNIFTTLVSKPPYSNWFSSSATMFTGPVYNPRLVDPFLEQARMGSCRYTATLARIIGQEFALRWVYREGLA